MIGRLLATIVVLLLAFGAFWGDPFGEGYSIGALFLFFAVVTWFRWKVIRGGFYAAKENSTLPIIPGWRPTTTSGNDPPLHRSSS
jgi:hypothetical protein